MPKKDTVTMRQMENNENLEDTIRTLEIYEEQPIEEFERLFAYAKIDKKEITKHLEFMRRMREFHEEEFERFNEDDYIFVHKQSLIDAFNGKPPKWIDGLASK